MVIGLEVHVELKTKTKIFCSCPTDFGAEPNTHVCPVCMGLPGSLPVLNRKVVEYAVKAGLATGCTIARYSKQDRKNYFYPDLPKAYQISQYDLPLCEHGHLDIETSAGPKRIGITRIHIEEDAGKLVHDGGGTYIDCNRCGVPLIEIVRNRTSARLRRPWPTCRNCGPPSSTPASPTAGCRKGRSGATSTYRSTSRANPSAPAPR